MFTKAHFCKYRPVSLALYPLKWHIFQATDYRQGAHMNNTLENRIPSARCIVALDVPTLTEAEQIVDAMPDGIEWFKVGLQLFVREGNSIIDMLKKRNKKLFLDLKFHDIPNTVANAVKSAAGLNVDMLTLHASGGDEMMRAARRAARSLEHSPALIAVTALTSLNSKDIADMGMGMRIDSYASFLASKAIACNMDGIVCSAMEAKNIRSEIGPKPLLVTPGIRMENSHEDDQKRPASPRAAADAGADYLVVGRPIIQAPDPAAAARQILDQIAG